MSEQKDFDGMTVDEVKDQITDLQTKADVAKAEANLAKSYIVDSLVKDGRGAFAREDLEKLDFLTSFWHSSRYYFRNAECRKRADSSFLNEAAT